MLWHDAAIRGTETSYILITTQQLVEMPMLSVQSLRKTIKLLLKCQITEIQKNINLLKLQYVDFT